MGFAWTAVVPVISNTVSIISTAPALFLDRYFILAIFGGAFFSPEMSISGDIPLGLFFI